MQTRQRQELLSAMGVDVYLLRTAAGVATDAPAPASPSAVSGLVVACASAASEPRAARLRALLPLALGIDAARVTWIGADSRGALAAVPDAAGYLALGSDMPRALGAHLSTMQQMSATIAAADAPAASLRDGLSKRALWQALKPLARRLRAAH